MGGQMIKQAWWKRILSYLFEWHIESRSSEYNPYLYVSFKKDRYQLSTAHAVYSYADLYDNFGGTFEQIDWTKTPVKRVLVLGLGLGSIPLLLQKHLGQTFDCTAVEIDEAVIGLASNYGLPAITAPVEVVCADAGAYLAQTTNKFDLICMDVFLDDVVPEDFEQQAFLQDMKDSLAPNGFILYNRLAATWHDARASEAFYKDKFLPVFPNGDYLTLNGNMMLTNKQGLF